MAGKIIADQIQSTTVGTLDTQYVVKGSAKAWTSDETLVSSNTTYTGDTFNVSSVTDSTTGQCLVNFASAMGNTGFSSHGTQNGYSVNDIVSTKEDQLTTTRDDIYIYDGAYKDAPFSYVVFGDLA